MCPPLHETEPVTESLTSLTVDAGVLNIATSDFDARPMGFLTAAGRRTGYEPEPARAICQSLGLTPVGHNLPMAELYTCLATGQYDAVWFNQAITPARLRVVDFTPPYVLFDKAVLVKKGSGIASVPW